MENENKTLRVEAVINAPLEKVWQAWTSPDAIVQWNNASDEQYTPAAENDLREGGKFLFRMEARDQSFAFDFTGTYSRVEEKKLLDYVLIDERKVSVTFSEENGATTVTQTLEPDSDHTPDTQQQGWQAILDSFKKYVEKNPE